MSIAFCSCGAEWAPPMRAIVAAHQALAALTGRGNSDRGDPVNGPPMALGVLATIIDHRLRVHGADFADRRIRLELSEPAARRAVAALRGERIPALVAELPHELQPYAAVMFERMEPTKAWRQLDAVVVSARDLPVEMVGGRPIPDLVREAIVEALEGGLDLTEDEVASILARRMNRRPGRLTLGDATAPEVRAALESNRVLSIDGSTIDLADGVLPFAVCGYGYPARFLFLRVGEEDGALIEHMIDDAMEALGSDAVDYLFYDDALGAQDRSVTIKAAAAYALERHTPRWLCERPAEPLIKLAKGALPDGHRVRMADAKGWLLVAHDRLWAHSGWSR